MICISPMGESAQSYVESTTVLSDPSKNQLARFLQDYARILHARLAWHDSCTILHDLASSFLLGL